MSARGVRTSDHLPVVARIEATLVDACRPVDVVGRDERRGASLLGSRVTLCAMM